MMSSVNSLAVMIVVPCGKSILPAKDLPEASDEISAWKYMFENFLQGDPLFVSRKYTHMCHASLSPEEIGIIYESLIFFLVEESIFALAIVAY